MFNTSIEIENWKRHQDVKVQLLLIMSIREGERNQLEERERGEKED